MTRPVSGIDHVLLVVNALDAGVERLRKLGFTVSPRGVHSPHLGSANNTVVFQKDYIELLGIVVPTPHNAIHRENLARGEGIHAAAITTENLDTVVDTLGEAGIRTAAPIEFSRPVATGNGSVEASFTVVRPERTQLPTGFMFYCHHKTPHLVWQRQWMTHPNTAEAIDGVIIAADDPVAAADIYGKLLLGAKPRPVEGGVRVPSGKAALDFLMHAAVEERYGRADVDRAGSPFFKALRIRVGSLDEARRVLDENHIDHIASVNSVLLPASAGCGVVFEFTSGARS